jgi:hypothetical protein
LIAARTVRMAVMLSFLAASHGIATAAAGFGQAAPRADLRNESRESFLRAAEVVSREIVDVGITLPARVELELDGVRRSAMFKSAELAFPSRVRVGREVQDGLRDSWKYEIAAYELDKLLELEMVPATVARTIDDRDGALIDWVDDVLPEHGASPGEFDLAAWNDHVATVWLFDYLAYNIDRTPENLLITGGFGVKLIDHSRAFQRFLVPMRPLSRFPRRVVDRLRALSDNEIVSPLAAYLTGEEIDALLERRRRVLQRVDGLLASKPEGEVLF